jgi:hypothetical protein
MKKQLKGIGVKGNWGQELGSSMKLPLDVKRTSILHTFMSVILGRLTGCLTKEQTGRLSRMHRD